MSAVDLARILSSLRPSAYQTLFKHPETLRGLFEPTGGPLELAAPDARYAPTQGTFEWTWQPVDGGFDLVVTKGGLVGGGAAQVILLNPLGADNNQLETDVTAIALCVNMSVNVAAHLKFDVYSNAITKRGAWPTQDLFPEIIGK